MFKVYKTADTGMNLVRNLLGVQDYPLISLLLRSTEDFASEAYFIRNAFRISDLLSN